MKKLVECVPNFSEGRDMNIIKQITDQIESVEGIRLLDVDPGKATNRTVVTFIGEPEPVIEAAFRAIKKASELIDMSKHKGEHPRMGATDVCPLIPVANISMDETVEFAHKLAKRVGEELQIPVYCYEFAAFDEKRRNLAYCRSGEYEGLEAKLALNEWKPDFGQAVMNPKAGASVIGARNFLVAYNVSLNTTSVRRANAIAFDIREVGRIKREGDPLTGKIVKDEHGEPVRIPGTLQKVKAIGWFIEEYGIAQISINLTDLTVTPIHIAFEEVCERAAERGIRVTGSELVGLVPLQAMLEAGRYFLRKQKRSVGVDDDELIKIAVKSLGLDDLKPFNPKEKIIEYLIEQPLANSLIDMTVTRFVNITASEAPAPGGGSVAALMGALAAALATMVANLSSHKRGWDERWEEFSDWAEKGQALKLQLLKSVDTDTQAFNKLMEAFGLPKSTPGEAAHRQQSIFEATLNAMLVPFSVMKLAYESMTIIEAMATTGNPNSVSDAGVAALAAKAAVSGAYLNVKINAKGLNTPEVVQILNEAAEIEHKATEMEKQVLQIVNKVIA